MTDGDTPIRDPVSLQQRVGSWPPDAALALDTEFVRERTYYPKLCLIQAAIGGDIVLIDVLAIDDGGAIAPVLTDPGRRFFSHLGIDVASLLSTRRPLCRACLDWSERRPHLAGALGAELLRHIYKERWATRAPDGRAVHFSPRGLRFFEALLSEAEPKRSTKRPRL